MTPITRCARALALYLSLFTHICKVVVHLGMGESGSPRHHQTRWHHPTAHSPHPSLAPKVQLAQHQ